MLEKSLASISSNLLELQFLKNFFDRKILFIKKVVLVAPTYELFPYLVKCGALDKPKVMNARAIYNLVV